MILPKIQYKPTTVEIPSTKQKLSIRSLTARDDRTLQAARENTDQFLPMLKAIKSIVAGCITSERFDVNSLTLFDLEWLYLQIYAMSSKEKHKVAYQDRADNEIRSFDIDLKTVGIKWPEKDLRKIKVTDTMTLCLNYPTVKLLDDETLPSLTPLALAEKMTLHCVDKIIDGQKVFDAKLERVDEIKSWLDDIPTEAYEQLQMFFNTLPTIYYEVEYINKNQEERQIVLRSLNDFFTWT